jgi:LL-H family phage holin
MNDAMNILFKLALTIIFVVITNAIIPYLKSKIDDARWAKLIDIVQVAVEAAEQTIHEPGPIKKESVMMFLVNWLSANEIQVSNEEIDRLVEHAVYVMNERKSKS